MAARKTATATKAKGEMRANTPTVPATSDAITLDWNLSELPSSQHRTGLVGLVLVIRWLERKHGLKGTCRLSRLDARGATLELDREGLRALFDEIYAAASEETPRDQPLKNQRTKAIIPPLRTEDRVVVDKKGKERTKSVYIYPQIVPAGSFLADLDSPGAGGSGLWIKLWRDLVWGVLRGIPATRGPFEARAAGEESADTSRTWRDLVNAANPSVELPSTYYVGAQATTAETVDFTDRARQLFLLHFWPFATPVYVPQTIDNDGKRDFAGFALVFADVRDLEAYCDEYRFVLEKRGREASGYRPREAVIDLAVEGALDLMAQLAERTTRIEGRKATSDLVLGYDVVHLERDGNNVRVRATTRVEPDRVMVDNYARIRGAYWSARFRRQRLLNLFNHRLWFAGFERIAATVPSAQLIDDGYFRKDAREAFNLVEKEPIEMSVGERSDRSLEELVYTAVGVYISRRVESKTQLRWDAVKDNPGQKQKYEEARHKIAKNAFLGVRSRTGADFVEYFTGTLCSVPQHVGENGYLALSRALLENPETIRTLTLLALSARA